MKGPIFLDTNLAILWSLGSNWFPISLAETISRHPRALVSSISVAEVEIKGLLRKLNLKGNFVASLEGSGIQIESFDQDAAEQINRFDQLVGHDPFDRLILAQASSHRNSTFYTTDRKLASLGLNWVVYVAK